MDFSDIYFLPGLGIDRPRGAESFDPVADCLNRPTAHY
jgi:hypothetical protein